MSATCDKVFICHEEQGEDNHNEGEYFQCPQGLTVRVDLFSSPLVFECVDNGDVCMGVSYHVGGGAGTEGSTAYAEVDVEFNFVY